MMLKGKNVLITGSSRGIGWAIANLLAKEGANIIITGRSNNATSTLPYKYRTHLGQLNQQLLLFGEIRTA
ncbi:MAG: SDR family NAD(P)-dependent oxidoreductase [Candidatus Kapaibacterium sp.]